VLKSKTERRGQISNHSRSRNDQQLPVSEIAVTAAEAVDIWTAESIGGVFPSSRLREIRDAQDVLTHTEKRVYDVFWGSNDFSDDRERIVRKGYDVAAKEARVTKRNIAKIVQRLINKGFLELVAPPVVYGQRTPATYRVISFAAVREDQERKGREWVIRTGRGIGYARKLVGHERQG
jgi:hypothetical protein